MAPAATTITSSEPTEDLAGGEKLDVVRRFLEGRGLLFYGVLIGALGLVAAAGLTSIQVFGDAVRLSELRFAMLAAGAALLIGLAIASLG